MYQIVEFDTDYGWVRYVENRKTKFNNYEEARAMLYTLKDEKPDQRFDISFSPSNRTGPKRKVAK
jgi:hypothetical protein